MQHNNSQVQSTLQLLVLVCWGQPRLPLPGHRWPVVTWIIFTRNQNRLYRGSQSAAPSATVRWKVKHTNSGLNHEERNTVNSKSKSELACQCSGGRAWLRGQLQLCFTPTLNIKCVLSVVSGVSAQYTLITPPWHIHYNPARPWRGGTFSQTEHISNEEALKSDPALDTCRDKCIYLLSMYYLHR